MALVEGQATAVVQWIDPPSKHQPCVCQSQSQSTPSDACIVMFHFIIASNLRLPVNHLSADTIDLSLGWADVDDAAGEAGDAAVNTVEGATRSNVAVELDVGDAQAVGVVADRVDAAVDGEGLGVTSVGSSLELDVDVLDVALVLEGDIGEGGEGGGEGSEEGDGNGGNGGGLHFG